MLFPIYRSLTAIEKKKPVLYGSIVQEILSEELANPSVGPGHLCHALALATSSTLVVSNVFLPSQDNESSENKHSDEEKSLPHHLAVCSLDSSHLQRKLQLHEKISNAVCHQICELKNLAFE